MIFRPGTWKLLPRVLLQVLPLATLVLVATWYIAERATLSTVDAEVQKRLQLEAGLRADEIAWQLTTLRRSAYSLSINDLIVNGLVDREASTSYLPTFFRSYVAPGPQGAKLSLLDYRGRFIATNDAGDDYSNAPWLPQVMSGTRVFSIDGSGLLIAEPVLYEGLPEGIIVLRYEASRLAQLVKRSHGTPLVILDDGNRVLYSWSMDDVSTPVSELLTGDDWLHAEVVLPDHDTVRLVSFARRNQALAVLDNVRYAALFNIGFSLLALLGGIVLAVWLSVRPVARLSAELDAMGRSGDTSRRLSVIGGAELRNLAQSFNNLLARLAESTTSRDSLEREIAERTTAQNALRTKASELQALTNDLRHSNRELERFAYIASHDLQEPLRMVSSYSQLLQRRYRGKLDSKADEYIDYAVRGAKRMQMLLNDLLQYSRLGSNAKQLQPTDTALVVAAARDNLQRAIADEAATVTIDDELPVVLGDDVQLTQLFQNLIANAIKFRSATRPVVSVSAVQHDQSMWCFAVRDNGIGIPAEYSETIFEVFKRLHGATEYPGTGVGLAVCKRVVESHGGHIWVVSNIYDGTTFYFTLKDARRRVQSINESNAA